MVRYIHCLVLGLSLLGTPVVAAEQGAYEAIEDTTRRVMDIVEEAAGYADQDPERYFSELQSVLDGFVDFSGFSRSVMGPYASRERYQSLSPAGKQQLRDQVERFTEVMRTGLVRTYGKGLLAFGGSKVEIERPEAGEELEGKASIKQFIYNDEAEPYVIEYKLRRDRSGSWRLRNLIVETINLGVIYRNQFQAAARDAEGDLDAVIDNWTVENDEVDAA